MNKAAAHTRSWETAETIFGTALLLSLVLGYLIPLPLTLWLPRAASISAGVIFMLLGLALISVTRRQFRQASQPTDPGQPTTQVITTGVFSWSRNPLYLAGLLFFTGLAALLNSLWLVILLVPTMAAVQRILIAPEEEYLAEKFGEPYRRYLQTVHRWVGRKKMIPR